MASPVAEKLMELVRSLAPEDREAFRELYFEFVCRHCMQEDCSGYCWNDE